MPNEQDEEKGPLVDFLRKTYNDLQKKKQSEQQRRVSVDFVHFVDDLLSNVSLYFIFDRMMIVIAAEVVQVVGEEREEIGIGIEATVTIAN